MTQRNRRPARNGAGMSTGARRIPGRWKLEDAKARFSELVREARERGPQRVTVYGKDAVVVVSADEFNRLQSRDERPSLHSLLADSPLKDLEFGSDGEKSPVREVEL